MKKNKAITKTTIRTARKKKSRKEFVVSINLKHSTSYLVKSKIILWKK